MLAKINRNYIPVYWDDFFNDSIFKDFGTSACQNSTPAVNVMEEDAGYRIEVAAPGVSREDFHIEVENDVLTVTSEQKETGEEKNRRFMRREFSYTNFKRSFQLPEGIDLENIRASHEAGILTIELPKKEEVVQKAARQIEIN
jgi:HSP20 family protein